jgi:hypothetical protein
VAGECVLSWTQKEAFPVAPVPCTDYDILQAFNLGPDEWVHDHHLGSNNLRAIFLSEDTMRRQDGIQANETF